MLSVNLSFHLAVREDTQCAHCKHRLWITVVHSGKRGTMIWEPVNRNLALRFHQQSHVRNFTLRAASATDLYGHYRVFHLPPLVSWGPGFDPITQQHMHAVVNGIVALCIPLADILTRWGRKKTQVSVTCLFFFFFFPVMTCGKAWWFCSPPRYDKLLYLLWKESSDKNQSVTDGSR